jgi:hypothetical protein
MDYKRVTENEDFVEWCLDNQEALQAISTNDFQAFLQKLNSLAGGNHIAPRKAQAKAQAKPQVRRAQPSTPRAQAKPQNKPQKVQQLTCTNPECKSPQWERPSQRGKLPLLCPVCRGEPAPRKQQLRVVQRKPTDQTEQSGRGPWGKEGPPKGKRDWNERVDRADNPPKIIKMLENWGMKHGWVETTSKSEGAKAIARKAAKALRARRSRGDSAPKSSAAGN